MRPGDPKAPRGRAAREHQLVAEVHEPGRVQTRHRVERNDLVAQLVAELLRRPRSVRLRVEQKREDEMLDDVGAGLRTPGVRLFMHGKACPFRATAPGGCNRAGANSFDEHPTLRSSSGRLASMV